MVKENYLTITATTAIRNAIVTAIITVVVITAIIATIAEVFAAVIVTGLAKEWDIQIMNKLGKRDSENTLVYQEELQKS